MQELGNFFIGKSFGRKKQKENALREILGRFLYENIYITQKIGPAAWKTPTQRGR